MNLYAMHDKVPSILHTLIGYVMGIYLPVTGGSL